MRLFLLFSFLLYLNTSFGKSNSFPLEEVATRLGLDVVSLGKPFTYPGVNRLYTNQSFSRAMMIVENIKGKRQNVSTTVYPEFILVEYQVTETTYNSVAFVNVSRAELESYVSFHESNILKKIDRFVSLFLPKAHADTSCTTASLESLSGDSLQGLSHFYSSEYFQLASSCFMGVLEGLWDATGGMVESTVAGLKELTSNPKGFWNKKVESFKRLRNFLMEFEISMQKSWTSFKTLPDDVKSQMLCSFIGSIGTDTMIAILTAGGGLSKLAMGLQSFMSKFMKLEKVLSLMKRMGKLDEISPKFYDRVSKGLVSDKRLSAIETLSNNNFDDLSIQLLKCSL